MNTVSPMVTMPLGATYCQRGPSSRSVQLRQVRPLSCDMPQPLPMVPYHTSPSWKAKAWTKFHEMDRDALSLLERRFSHCVAPWRSTKMPSP